MRAPKDASSAIDPEIGPEIGVVAIGRNEGERLRRCLASIAGVASRVYVDSGSTDGSVEMARAGGTSVVELAIPPKFTAARARNAGVRQLVEERPDLEFVQLVDGDCEVQSAWIAAATAALRADPGLALVFGRRRERFPEASIYNALCDDEWNRPVGPALVCGGDILCRAEAFRAVGGYDETLIAGEDPDFGTRLRAAGWKLLRIDAEMTLHDAAITSFGQWWRRAKRAGHAFAELAHRHQGLRAPNWRGKCRSILAWGFALPLVTLATLALGTFLHPIFLLATLGLLALWPLNMVRLARSRRDLPRRTANAWGVLVMVAKFPELLGLIQFHRGRLSGRRSELIEYK
ncbi:glycosyltransferase family 2 protein [Sphingomonas sp.]|uniref:glycosyltransferase n=1 Tax=Sphingomonas sp. TaxID=28214 RepID=UPI001B131622|nr:glycosyltransferase family 2 protein [Sphingomonas sp.]MBO9714534.1 glycosyltransferase [Sphingomonas sp.]